MQLAKGSTLTSRAQSTIGRRAIVPEWLLDAGVSANAIRLFAVIDAKYADRDGQAWPSRRRLATDLGVASRDTIDRAIAELVKVKAMTVERRTDDAGDPTSSLYTLHHEGPEGSRTDAATLPDKSGDGRRRAAATGSRTDAAQEPSSIRTPVLSEPGARLEERASRPPSERELRAATKAALDRLRAEWLAGRATAGLDRYVDRGALRGLEQRVESALGRGIEERDLSTAIQRLSREPKGSPWYVDERAKQIALEREQADHERRKVEERAELERLHDEQALRDRSGVGLHRPRFDVPRETMASD